MNCPAWSRVKDGYDPVQCWQHASLGQGWGARDLVGCPKKQGFSSETRCWLLAGTAMAAAGAQAQGERSGALVRLVTYSVIKVGEFGALGDIAASRVCTAEQQKYLL
eukprot:1159069-Pelagomonas_calceolata.AAC.2